MSLNKSWSRQRKEKRITRMILLMIMAFNISWLPYAFVCTLKLVQHNFVPDAWAVPGLLLAKWYYWNKIDTEELDIAIRCKKSCSHVIQIIVFFFFSALVVGIQSFMFF